MSEAIARFIARLRKHAVRKAKLYDGVNNAISADEGIERWLRYLIEEVGEVASAVNRDRLELARDECVDVAHVAMLMYMALEAKIAEVNHE